MAVPCSGEVAEWSKALRSGRSLFGGVGSNPTLTSIFQQQIAHQRGLRGARIELTTLGL